MKISMFGLGHIGLVTGLFLASKGHDVTGIEIVEEKIKALNSGKMYIHEPGLFDLFSKSYGNNFRAVLEVTSLETIIFVCVGTPSLSDGSVDLQQIISTTELIGKLVASSNKVHQIIYRSTVPPGTIENVVIPLLEKYSSKVLNTDFLLYYFPEFLREGSALADFATPSLNVWASSNGLIPEFYENLTISKNEIELVSFKSAEMIKYFNNTFHGLKVAFANEMASVAASMGIDSEELFNVFFKDRKLNISEKYLNPGFSFGGPCLPKEIHGLMKMAKTNLINVPIIESILDSNEEHTKRLVNLLESSKYKKIGIIGLTFKANTSDLRNSPLLDLVGILNPKSKYKRHFKIKVFDPNLIEEEPASRYEVIKKFEDFIIDLDLIIFGPYQLPQTQIEIVINSKTKILDLHYFKLEETVKNQLNYQSFFEKVL